jgi:hypothetical protein
MAAPSTPELTLSVVVAAWNDPIQLRACLRSLGEAAKQQTFEVIVAYPPGRGFEACLRDRQTHAHGAVTLGVPVFGAATVPQLRKSGLAQASGAVVAFTEDHATVGPGWSAALLREFESAACVAVGGPVAQGSGLSSLDWAAYLFDYGRFMPPVPFGSARELSGLNMSFARSVLIDAEPAMADGVFEGPLLERLRRNRHEMHLAPLAVVYHNKRYQLREALVSVFHLGRGYAGRRLERARRGARLARVLSCSLLPSVLLWRTLPAALVRSREKWRVVSSFGYLSLIALSWSVGECVGYIAGSGDSDARWR